MYSERGNMFRYVSCLFIFFSLCLSAEAATRIVVIGSSTAAGYSLPAGAAWVTQYRTYLTGLDHNNQVINLAVSGYTTYHFMPNEFTPPLERPKQDLSRNISIALTYRPDAIIINLPTNDIAKGHSIQEILYNYAAIVKLAEQHNVQVWITTTQPASWSSSVLRNRLIELNKHLYEIYGDKVIDFWSGIATSTGTINNAYRKDKVHLNSAGHRILFSRVSAKNIDKMYDKGTRKLYLTGGVTDALWDGAKAIPFIQDVNDPNIYTLTCELRHRSITYGTQFRILYQPDINGTGLFPTKKDEMLTDNPTLCVKKASSASNAYRWTVPTERQGYYKLTVNLSNNTLTPEYLGKVINTASELYLFGGATESKWDMSKAIPFVQDTDNPNLFRVTCLLRNKNINLGNSFRIFGKKDSIEFYVQPLIDNLPLKIDNQVVAKIKPAAWYNKWVVPEDKQGYYILTVDISSKTLTAQYYGRTDVLPTALYLIGGVTEAGWGNGSNGIPFVQDMERPNIFTLNCLLKHNDAVSFGDQFRILEQPHISQGKGLFPFSKMQTISTISYYSEKTTVASANLNRWFVPKDKQGYYKIIVDILAKTLRAEYLGVEFTGLKAVVGNDNDFSEEPVLKSEESVNTMFDNDHSILITTCDDNSIRVLLENNLKNSSVVRIVTLDGRIIVNKKFNDKEIVIRDLPKGLCIVSVINGNISESKKVIIK